MTTNDTSRVNKYIAHATGLSRIEELTNSMLINGGDVYSSQVVNNGVIFVFNGDVDSAAVAGGNM